MSGKERGIGLPLASNLKKSLILSVVLAVVFSIPMFIHAIEEEFYYVIEVPDEYEQLLKTILTVIYPIAAFKLGQGSASRSRGTLSGLTLGVVRASVETIVHPRYLFFYSETLPSDALMSLQAFIDIDPLQIILNFLQRNLLYIFLGAFIASLGGLYEYLNRVSKPLKRKAGTGNAVYVFRDYWSNRQMFDKNRFPEDPDLDLSPGDKPHSRISPELYLSFKGEHVDVIDGYRNRVLTSNLLNPEYLAARFEPVWNPIPLAVEKKMTKSIMPLSIALSMLSIFLSFINIIPLVAPVLTSLQNITLANLLYFITVVGAVLFNTVFPVVFVFILGFILIAKVRRLRETKPESSLTLLFLFLFMPLLTFGTVSISYNLMMGNNYIANAWMPILLVSLIFLFISSLRIRDFENVSIYLYQNAQNDMAPLWYQQDVPVWAQGDFYWVFRYMYFWPVEMTIPFPHTDWERVEVWVNARTGQAEWITTDYHYRELWYQIVGSVPRIFVDFDPNFHTPLPITFNDELDNIQQVLFQRLSVLSHIGSQLRYITRGRWYNLWVGISFESQLRAAFREMHPEELLTRLTGSKMLAGRLASLHWRNWRYPQGADRKDVYSAVANNFPASVAF